MVHLCGVVFNQAQGKLSPLAGNIFAAVRTLVALAVCLDSLSNTTALKLNLTFK